MRREVGRGGRLGPLQLWCLRHAGRTGHTGFRGTVVGFFRASLEEVL
ncbi:hypothetical protein V2S66_06560 [Streptomyces sp. V4-01]|uniref:DUF7848 domain-containing protein n=1 Tax=Actinacidiphila polyblastidii TaxID=3110430 RepID=A0ABU7P7I8_9ACTN|nr:hypothetical protein [Streptomyces sp. V4-01]